MLPKVIENKILDPVNVSIYGKGAVAPNPHNVMDGPMEWLRRHLDTPFLYTVYTYSISLFLPFQISYHEKRLDNKSR